MTLFQKGFHKLETVLPASLSRKLAPEPDDDAEALDDGCSDLLSVSQRRLLSQQGRRDVVLGIETFTSLQSKVCKHSRISGVPYQGPYLSMQRMFCRWSTLG